MCNYLDILSNKPHISIPLPYYLKYSVGCVSRAQLLPTL